MVVGSGAGGATVARALALSGTYEVLILEKGQNFFSGLGGPAEAVTNLWSNDELAYQVRTSPFEQDPLLEPRTYRPSPSAGPRSYVGDVDDLPVTVGGATVHWDAKARRLREVDFMANTLLGGSSKVPAIPGTTYSDWPITYRQIEPFYGLMEELVGIQGPAFRDRRGRVVNPNPNESWRSTPFPMPPGVGMYSNLIQSDALRRLGYHPAPVPTAVNSRPYRGRPACVDCAYCIDYGCPINAKGGAVWLLNDALATGRATLQPGSNVVRVEVASGKPGSGLSRVDGVTYVDDDGRSHTVRADLVVLANSPIEAVRTSLASGIGRAQLDESSLETAQPGPHEPSGLLGRNLMLHYPTVVAAILDSPVHPWRGRNSTHVFDDFAGSGPDPSGFDPHVPRGGITEMGGSDFPINAAVTLAPSLYGEAHKSYMTSGTATQRGISFTLQGEDMPQLMNYVDLDPEVVDVYGEAVPRITYSNHPYELSAANYYTPKLIEVMNAIGGPGSEYPHIQSGQGFLLPSGTSVPSDRHIMGTHRMGLSPATGATNPFGRYWGFSNLYHAGGGLFVTAPGYNPTLTIWALSYWLAAGIITNVATRESFDTITIENDWPHLLKVIGRLDPRSMAAQAARA